MFVRPLLFVCLMLFTSLFIQTAQAKDSYTYANLEDVRVSHLYLDLQVDFQKQALIGFAELTLDWQHKERNHITLDTRDLDIKKVYARRADGQWRQVPFQLAARDAVLGSKLTITPGFQPKRIRVQYQSTPAASGLQWLSKAQT
ncbi:aminopeptidase, partial [Alishewanella sp. SMS9]|nr:aminopeptidase [Alishewanella sp. SMS9]